VEATGGAAKVVKAEVSVSDMEAEPLLKVLGSAVEDKDAVVAEKCCKRIRVLCRDLNGRKACHQFGAARILCVAYRAFSPTFTEGAKVEKDFILQSLAALVNLCSGEEKNNISSVPRTKAVEEGAIQAASDAIRLLSTESEICEMACLVVQNMCFGDDEHAVARRKRAGEDGAIEAVIAVLSSPKHEHIRDTCISSMRLCVDRVPELRKRALDKGAPEEGVKPITKEGGGGLLSFRIGGFGTSRLMGKKKSAIQEETVKSPPATPPPTSPSPPTPEKTAPPAQPVAPSPPPSVRAKEASVPAPVATAATTTVAAPAAEPPKAPPAEKPAATETAPPPAAATPPAEKPDVTA